MLRDLCLQWFTVLKRGPRADNTNKTVNMFSFGHRFGFLSSFMVLLFPPFLGVMNNSRMVEFIQFGPKTFSELESAEKIEGPVLILCVEQK